MIIPLDINSFEHFFDEPSLKKGLYLFQKNKIKQVEKLAGGEYYFIFKTKSSIELHLKKKGNKIIKYQCSCGKTNCEHLCAAIFNLSGDKLIFQKLNGKLLNQKAGEDPFSAYCGKLRLLIRKDLRINSPEDIGEKNKKAFGIINTFCLFQKNINTVFLHLAILSEFSEFFIFRKNLTDEIVNNVLSVSFNTLMDLKAKGLSGVEKSAWFMAAKNSLKSHNKFKSGVFSFLIPFAVNVTSDKTALQELRIMIGKRKLKTKFKHYLDMQLVAKLQIQLREFELFKKGSPDLRHLNPELSIAKAGLKSGQDKKTSAGKILLKDYDKIKKAKPANFINYIDYLINLFRELKDDQAELFFIKEIILHDHIIPVKYLERMRKLLRGSGRDKEIDELINNLKKQLPEIYFDKLCQLLESENRLDELVVELGKHSNKFRMINKIAIKKLPQFDKSLLMIYVKHLVNVLYEARESYHQKQIFEMAKVYFDKLPQKVAIDFVSEILEKISKNNFIYGHLKKYIESREA